MGVFRKDFILIGLVWLEGRFSMDLSTMNYELF